MDGRIEAADGRVIGFADFGSPADRAVLWCHGGPGSRLQPEFWARSATGLGFRLVGIDRPGYGLSTPMPGRTIAAWVPDALAVADQLKIDGFMTVGVSTGGAYALALASMAPQRVVGVVACCALSDVRWAEGRHMVLGATQGIWDAPNRAAALAMAVEAFGDDGSKALAQSRARPTAAADLQLVNDPEYQSARARAWPENFAHGVAGYVDDRIADGQGWGSFDVSGVRCPTIVLHGGADTIVPVAHGRYTASLVAGSRLEIFEDLGHTGIQTKIIPALVRLAAG